VEDSTRRLSPLFISQFEVDPGMPFERHLNRLEVEIGREDYSQLKQVERVVPPPAEAGFAAMQDLTGRLLRSTQNNYNRSLLTRLEIRIYLDDTRYEVYYRLPGQCLRFVPTWRNRVLAMFLHQLPLVDSDWVACRSNLPGFEGRYLADEAGGVLLLRRIDRGPVRPVLITASHGPYDPHTLETTLYFLRTGKGDAALVNLGFAGREPLSDENLRRLTAWGVPLNPSNIDVIYPYADQRGHPYCYKLEEGLRGYIEALEIAPPSLILDIHGCVGTSSDDRRVIVGLGGLPPFTAPERLGRYEDRSGVLHLSPEPRLREGLALLRDLSTELFLQFCAAPHACFNFAVLGRMQMLGARVDPRHDVQSLLAGEERAYLPHDNLRWLPAAGANALQRIEARRLDPGLLCLHVEIPTAVRRKMLLRLQSLAIEASYDSSHL